MDQLNPPDLFTQYISIFDKAEYHAKAKDFPKTTDYYQAYIHMGCFLGFLAEEQLLSEANLNKKKVKQFIDREITPGELCQFLGGKIDPLDLNMVGKKFSYYYYPGSTEDGDIIGVSSVTYFEDYCTTLSSEMDQAGSVYLLDDKWENYDKVKERICSQYKAWITAGSPEPQYRKFKSLSESDAEKIKTYLRNTFSIGLLNKKYPDVSIEETTFKSYTITIEGRDDQKIGNSFYPLEAKIRDYLKKFTDKRVWFNLK